MSKEKLVFICAHPDDEAFGPSGTLALMAKTHDVHLLCATRGEAGQKHFVNPSEHIASVRERELNASASTLGIKKVLCLNFIDGELCNNIYHHLAASIQERLDQIRPETVMTFEQLGVSGHMDHIMVSLVVTYLFERLSYIKKLMYFCAPIEATQKMSDYFIYFPSGYRREQVDEIVDVSSVWDVKLRAMKQHASQQKDFKRIKPILEQLPKVEYFLIKTK